MPDIEISLGEIALAGDERKAPSEFRILAAGETKTRNGPVWFDARASELVLAEYAADGRPLAIDYEHAHIPAKNAPPSEKRAAGWFVPADRAGELWATEVEWTSNGRAAVESKEFRFSSLWGDGAKDGARVRLVRLRNVALTNTPAVLNSVPLVNHETPSEVDMPHAVILALGCSDEAEAISKASAMSLVLAEAESITGKKDATELLGALRGLKLRAERADALELELTEIKTAGEKRERDALIIKLSENGQLPPSMHEWARTLPMTALVAFSEAAPSLVTKPSDEPKEPAPADMLDPEIKRQLDRQGLTEDDYRAANAAGAL